MSDFSLPWNEEFVLDGGELDAEHHRLLDKLNALLTVLDSQDMARIGLAANSLIVAAKEHFVAEEERMDACHYPQKTAHCAHHDVLLETLEGLRYQISVADQGFESVIAGLYPRLAHWFAPHVTKDDRAFVSFLAAKQQRTGEVMPLQEALA